MIIKNLINLSLLILLTCCASTQTPIASTNYRLDMSITDKDSSYTYPGIAILPKRSTYNFLFTSTGKLDLFTFRTCSREIAIENARRGIHTSQVLLSYTPNAIELSGACPIEVIGLSESKKDSWGFIDFEDTSTTLPATVICGESVIKSNGVSACQGRVGLLEQITFTTDVMTSPRKGCDDIKSENNTYTGKIFRFRISNGHCVYEFVQTSDPTKVHRLNTYGYTDILLVD
jgi:hypothetical protein